MAESIEQVKKKVYVETTVISESAILYAANASGGRTRMIREKRYDEGLEEIWRIKREIAAEYPTLEDYFKGMLAFQEEERRRGVKFVRLPSRSPDSTMA